MPPANVGASLHISPATGKPGLCRISLSGKLDADSSAALWKEAQALAGKLESGGKLELDASGLSFCNGAGVGLMLMLREAALARQAVFSLYGLSPEAAEIFNLYSQMEVAACPDPGAAPGLVEQAGRAGYAVWLDMRAMIAFVGEFCLALCKSAFNPGRVRWRDFFSAAENCGLGALPIIILIGFLMGLIMAFQSAIPLRRFAAEIFVANLLGLSLFRELGPLVTAIILAGRTGSAYAAELGAMTLNEEVNALKTMGLEPVRFLTVTRVLAAMLVTPFLTVFFNLFGLLGGATVMLGFGYPLTTFCNQVLLAVKPGDLLGGLFKSMVFSLLVCAVGCLRGLETRGGASAVGRSTTSAVVSAIILIAITDGIFAITFYALKL